MECICIGVEAKKLGLINVTYHAVIVKPGPLGYTIVKKKKLGRDATKIEYKDKVYLLNWQKALPQKRKKVVLYLEFETGNTLDFISKATFTPDQLKVIIPTELAKVSLKGAITGNYGLIVLILAFAVGIGLGVVIGQNFLTSPRVIIPAGA